MAFCSVRVGPHAISDSTLLSFELDVVIPEGLSPLLLESTENSSASYFFIEVDARAAHKTQPPLPFPFRVLPAPLLTASPYCIAKHSREALKIRICHSWLCRGRECLRRIYTSLPHDASPLSPPDLTSLPWLLVLERAATGSQDLVDGEDVRSNDGTGSANMKETRNQCAAL